MEKNRVAVGELRKRFGAVRRVIKEAEDGVKKGWEEDALGAVRLGLWGMKLIRQLGGAYRCHED